MTLAIPPLQFLSSLVLGLVPPQMALGRRQDRRLQRGGFVIRSAQPGRRALRLAGQSKSDALQRRAFARNSIPN
jgi:hypothetical protein